ncbi:TetR family transcriptional regulator [Sphingobacterium alimentarium]|uniref:TetR family transcriptional regulator n=2 Tax=Sphingobacterium alimentarium TaxID=797292 RepID=A0A4R3VRZ0_9SPHI|nr:TetR family transcriptional regulator [Sphingobacterium alimentarium]
MSNPSRKAYQGKVNNKEKTMAKLLSAVGKVLEKKGYTGLTPTNIAKVANVDRKLIKLYFGSVDNLIETYIRSKDYWLLSSDNISHTLENEPPNGTQDILENLLLDQLNNFLVNNEMQKAVTWQISEKSAIMSEITRKREEISKLFFEKADKELPPHVDIRAISSILVSGIYYLVLHSKHTESTVCEIELDENGFERIRAAIKQIITWAYSK